ncbi:hypothetical protein UlMin_041937 [Ulmus minor]
MALRLNISRWWAKDSSKKGNRMVVTMENPNCSVLEINGPDEAFQPVDKDRGKNAKQFTWVLLLKAHRTVSCVAWLENALWALLGAIKKRLIFGEGWLAHSNGWHYFQSNSLHIPHTSEIKGWFHTVYVAWLEFRVDYIAPAILSLSNFCISLFLIQSADRMLLCLAVCQLNWPKERLLIQVLDDSDNESIEWLIKGEVSKWNQKGVNKAGHCLDNPKLGLVQASGLLLTRMKTCLLLQNINLCFHFEVEQQVNGVFLNFFGFKGTAGVWRIKALEESGGWLERTTVEDMDIAVRAHLNGWKFIFLNNVKVLGEFPESYETPRYKHFSHSILLFLFLASYLDGITMWKKANLILLFFLLRKLILPFYSLTLFCIILPLTMFVPEAELPIWVICYVPVFTSFPFIVPYLLFENTMSVTKFNAMVSGLFQLGSSYEWVVTKKAGRSSESDLLAVEEKETKAMNHQQLVRGTSDSGLSELSKLREQQEAAPKPPAKKMNKIFKKELALAFLLLTAAVRSLLSAQGVHFYFLLFQGVTFLLVGLDLIGEQMS